MRDRDWEEEIQSTINQHTRTRRRSIIGVFLALIVAVGVFGSLILPAISITMETAQEASDIAIEEEPPLAILSSAENAAQRDYAIQTLANYQGEYQGKGTNGTYNGSDGTGYNFAGNITGSTITVGSGDSKKSTSNGKIVVDESYIESDANGEYVSASIEIDFKSLLVAAATGNTGSTAGLYVSSEDEYGNHTIYYELPDEISVNLTEVGYILDQSQGWSGSSYNPYYTDLGTSSSSESGIYWFVQDEETGKCYIVIEFMNEYLQYALSGQSISGDVTFSGKIYRANTADGDVTFSIGSATYIIDFPDLKFSVAKSGALVQGDDGNYYIEWTITIDNPSGATLNGATISDTYLSRVSSYTIEPSNVTLTQSGSGYTIGGVSENDTTITITYKTEVSLSDFNANDSSTSATYTNDVTLEETVDEETITATNSASVTVKNTTISKSGQADYYETGSAGGEINWTVTLTNQLGTSLAGYVIEDALTGGTGTIETDTIKIVDSDGKTLTLETDYTVSESGGKVTITFNDNVTASSVTITYSSSTDTTATDDVCYNNTVRVNDGPSASASVTYKSYDSLFKIDKNGSYDYDTGVITWTVTLKADTYNNPNATLKGQTITDARFSNLEAGNLTFTTNVWNINSTYADASTVYTIDDDSITIVSDSITSITFTYTTAATEEEIAKEAAENTASVSDGKHTGYAKATVGVGKRHSISKRITSSSSGTDYGQETTREISYAVSIIDDDGIEANTSTLIDVIESSDENVTISLDESSIVVTVKTVQNGEAILLTENTDYTVKYDETNHTITITFISDNYSDYHYIDISYTVEATFGDIACDEDGSEIEPTYITNGASWGSYTSDKVQYTENHTNPYKKETQDMGVQKVWNFESDPSTKPESVTFTLQVSKDGATFADYYVNWSKVTITLSDSDGNAASDGAIWTTGTVTPSAVIEGEGWYYCDDGYYLYKGLIKSEVVEENGTYVEHTYKYQWVESFDGQDENWTMSSTVDADTGLYTITNSYAMHITKRVVDGEGNDITGQQITLDDLVCDGEYYYVNYVVDIPYNDGIVDIIPDGFEVVHKDVWDNGGYLIGTADGIDENGNECGLNIYDGSGSEENTWEYLLANKWGGYFPGPIQSYETAVGTAICQGSLPLAEQYSNSQVPENWETTWTSSEWTEWAEKGLSGQSAYHLEGEDDSFYNGDVLYIASDITGSSMPHLCFSLRIRKADLEEKVNAAIEQGGAYTFTNIAHNDNYATDSTASLSIGEAPEKDTSILEKVATDKQGQVDYTLIVNPDGKTLSNDDTYDIVDRLTTIDMEGYDYTLMISDVKAYYINEDGSRGDALPSSMYSYSVNLEPSYAYETPESEVIEVNKACSNNDKFNFNSDGNDVESIVIKLNSMPPTDWTGFKFESDGIAYASWGDNYSLNTVDSSIYGASWDANLLTLTFSIKDGKDPRAVNNFYVQGNSTIDIDSITVNYVTSYTQTAYSTITITVPDATPLMIQYTYTITIEGKIENGVIVNEAEINTGNVIAIDSQKTTGFQVSESGGHSGVDALPQIAKVNVASTGENLTSSFYLKRYNVDTSKWEYAIYIGTDENGNLLVAEGDATVQSISGTKDTDVFVNEDDESEEKTSFDSCWVSEEYVSLIETDDGGLELVYTGESSLTIITGVTFVEATQDNDGDITPAHYQYTYTTITKDYELTNAATIDLENESAKYNTFNSNVLYALIEAKTPEGYQDAVNEVYYFVYDTSDITSAIGSSGVDSAEVNSIAVTPGKVAVPNNKLINISATKLWDNGELDSSWEVEYTLYYATEKGLSATSVDDIAKMTPIKDDSWTGDDEVKENATQTLTSTTDIAEWNVIPNGSNGDAWYYYVVETAYTINGTTYTLDMTDGYYKDTNTTIHGKYQPIYFNNGLCEDGSVTVNNSSGISIRKQWKNSDNSTKLSAPIDAIGFIIEGQNSGSESTLLAKGILTKDGGWTLNLNDCDIIGSENILSGDYYKTYYPNGGIYWYSGSGVAYSVETIFTLFDNITVTEYTLTDADDVSLYGYVKSVTYNIIDDSYGLITMTNKDSSPSSSSVKVTKEWEGISDSDRTGVYVTLFRTTESHTMSQLIGASSIPTDFEKCDTTLYYHLVDGEIETDEDGDVAKYTEEDITTSVTLSENTGEDEEDEEPDNPYAAYGYYVLVKGVDDATVLLDDTNNWQYVWEDLTYRDDVGNTWYYYVLETDKDGKLVNSDDWNVKYTLTNGSAVAPQYTVTNYTSGNLIIEKKWVDTDGNALASGDIPDSVTFQIYEKKDESGTAEMSIKTLATAGSGELPEELLVASIGDSITLGTFNGYADEYTYPYQLDDLLLSAGISPRSDVNVPTRSNGTKMIVDRNGANGAVISGIKGATEYDSYLPNADVVTLIAGTNDIINTSASMDSMKSDLTSLVNTVHSKNSSAVIFLATIPKFAALDWGNQRGIAQSSQWSDSKEQIQAQWDELVGEYNEMVAQVVSECSASMEIYLVDVYTATQDPSGTNEYGWLSADGCHPNQDGYVAIANAFYNAIYAYYTGETLDDDTDTGDDTGDDAGNTSVDRVTGLPSDFYKVDENGNYITDDDGNYVINTDVYGLVTGYSVSGTGGTRLLTQEEYDAYISGTAKYSTLYTDGDNGGIYIIVEPDDDGNWEVTVKGLDENGEYYVVEYPSLKGFTTTYDNNNGKSLADASRTVTVTNTLETFSLDVEKMWSDASDHYTDTVTVNLFRSISSADVPSQNPKLDIEGTTTVSNGKSVELTMSNPIASVTVSAGSSLVEVSYEVGGTTITVTAAESGIGLVTLSITDVNGIRKEITITVTDLPPMYIYDQAPTYKTDGTSSSNGNKIDSEVTLELGKDAVNYFPYADGVKLTGVAASGYDKDIVSVTIGENNKITITPKAEGETSITITAEDDEGNSGYNATISITVVLPEEWTIGDNTSVTVGSEITLTPSPSFGTFSWEITSGSNYVDIMPNDDGTCTVTGIAEGEAKITATRLEDGDSRVITVTVIAAPTGPVLPEWDLTSSVGGNGDFNYFSFPDSASGYYATSIIIEFYPISGSSWSTAMYIADGSWCGDNVKWNGSNWYLENGGPTWSDGTYSGDWECSTNEDNSCHLEIPLNNLTGSSTLYYDCNGDSWYLRYVITCKNSSGDVYYIQYPATSPTSLTPTSLSAVRPLTSTSSGYYVDSCTLSTTDDWKATFASLPLADTDGNYYYYWIEEETVSGYVATYWYNSESGTWIDAGSVSVGETASAGVENVYTESSGTTLPSTGGTGTMPYVITGATLMTGATAGIFIRYRRRRKSWSR